jgi:phosphoglycerate dehydrogenase-like enzyme
MFRPETWRAILNEFEVTENRRTEQLDHEELLAQIGDYDAVITGWFSPHFGRDVLQAAPHLRLIAHAGGSVKFLFDSATVREVVPAHGVQIYSGNDALALNVAEATIGMMIAASRQWPEHIAAFHRNKKRDYDYPPLNGPYLTGATVGLVSASKVAHHVLRLLQPFGCRILIYDPFLSPEAARARGAELVELDALFEQSDIVSLHAPSLPATEKMIGAAQLQKLRDGGVLINTSRGSVLDHDALLQECRNGRLLVALDVTWPEPLPAGSEFWELPNVMLIPHLSGAGYEGYLRIGDGVLNALRNCFVGLPFEGAVPLEKWDTLA